MIRKSKRENFLRLFLANSLIREGTPFTFYIFFGKALTPLPESTNGQIRQFYAVLDKKERLRAPENLSQVEARLAIRPFTVRVNCQIRGLTSIRKGLRKDNTPFLVSSNNIIASENVSGRVSGENLKSPREAIFTNPEGSQSGGGPILPIRWVLFLPIRKGPIFVNPEGYCFVMT